MEFIRFSVIRIDTREPIEGCCYSKPSKAFKRLRGMAEPVLYDVVPVTVSVPDGVPRPVSAASL
jgi:hypothetical protein